MKFHLARLGRKSSVNLVLESDCVTSRNLPSSCMANSPSLFFSASKYLSKLISTLSCSHNRFSNDFLNAFNSAGHTSKFPAMISAFSFESSLKKSDLLQCGKYSHLPWIEHLSHHFPLNQKYADYHLSRFHASSEFSFLSQFGLTLCEKNCTKIFFVFSMFTRGSSFAAFF